MRTWTGSTSGPWLSCGSTPDSARRDARAGPGHAAPREDCYQRGPGPGRAGRRRGSAVLAGTDARGGRRDGQRRPAGGAAGRAGCRRGGGPGAPALPGARRAGARLCGQAGRGVAGDHRQAAAAVPRGAAGPGRPEQRGPGGLPHGPAGALAVLALAFPLHPPGRPDRSRAVELAQAGTEVLVVNGAADAFGIPEAAGAVQVVVLSGGTHTLAGQGGAIRRVVGAWLTGLRARAPA